MSHYGGIFKKGDRNFIEFTLTHTAVQYGRDTVLSCTLHGTLRDTAETRCRDRILDLGRLLYLCVQLYLALAVARATAG